MEKKKWLRPMLTVLVRGRPEELILTNCKGKEPATPGRYGGSCNGDGECGECSERGKS